MNDDRLTGPWVLALGTLLVGVGAVTVEVLRQRRDRTADRESGDGAT